MSRTDKDRPWWVRSNDFTLAMKFSHEHLSFDTTYAPPFYGNSMYVLNYCTMFDRMPKRPVYVDSEIFEYHEDGTIVFYKFPCVRWSWRDVERRWNSSPHYHKHVMRPKERDFLKAEVKRYNSGYVDGDEYFMDEEVFTTRHYGVNGVGY